jgi:hypothetical protein
MGLTLNRMYQLLISADDVNLAEDNTNISKKGTEAYQKDVPEVNIDKV